jgi:hypothetical protein
MPELYHPGPAGYQRANATQRHDPYPLDDVAEPVVGGRPREFQRPVPGPVRAEQYDRSLSVAAGAAPAPMTFAPAPIGAPQPLPQTFGTPPVTTAPLGAPPAQSYPYVGAPAPVASPPPATYQYTAPAASPFAPAPIAPAPYPYGSPTPVAPLVSPSPIPQFRPPY